MSYKAEIKGLKELQLKLDQFPTKLHNEVKGVIERGAEVFVRNAQKDVPRDTGYLAGSIGYSHVKDLTYQIFASKKYAPYVEWGTITRVSVPAELQSYAIQFKGRGLKKNGGLYPRPFFFKQLPLAKASIEQGINAIIKEEKL